MENFGGQRLVRRGRAADGRRDVDIVKAQAVVTAQGSGLVCKSSSVQSLVQEIARAVTRENSARAIPAMRGGSKPKDKKFRVGITEAGYAASPISPFPERAPLLLRHLFPVFH
jgi:hypothetical protein